MRQYLNDLQFILDNGEIRGDRTGTGTIGVFGMQTRYDLRKYFPAVTTKKLAFKAVISELLWFIEGSSDERRLAEILYSQPRSELADKKTIWTANANASYWTPKAKFKGDLGVVYGVQWRKWQTGRKKWVHSNEQEDVVVDQLANLIQGIKDDPFGRRHILSAWNPAEIDNMALPPCHCLAQFYVNSKNELSCQLYQRSADMFLGIPFNIASYALLTHMIAHVCKLSVGDFVHTLGDAHIYLNHVDAVKEQLKREPLTEPVLLVNPKVTDITKFTMTDFELLSYTHLPAIKAEMAV
jgi:thymidylate synthase